LINFPPLGIDQNNPIKNREKAPTNKISIIKTKTAVSFKLKRLPPALRCD
jgi:hypothetical protein